MEVQNTGLQACFFQEKGHAKIRHYITQPLHRNIVFLMVLCIINIITEPSKTLSMNTDSATKSTSSTNVMERD